MYRVWGKFSKRNIQQHIQFRWQGRHTKWLYAGGPNAYEGAGLSRFAAKCYTKSTGDWVANEHTVYWNSALVFMSAYASQKAGSIVEPTPKPTEKPTPNPTPTTPNEGTNEVDVNINTGSGRRAISPYIYGSNQDVEATLTAKRFGGNRTTAYNWETNFSNAGNDWCTQAIPGSAKMQVYLRTLVRTRAVVTTFTIKPLKIMWIIQ